MIGACSEMSVADGQTWGVNLVTRRTFLEVKQTACSRRRRAFTDGDLMCQGCPSDDESMTADCSTTFVDSDSDVDRSDGWTTDDGEEEDVPCLKPCTSIPGATVPSVMLVPVPYMVPMWNYTVVAPAPTTFMPAVQPPALTHAVEESTVDGEEMTTVIFRNIPCDCTRDMLTSTLDVEGFSTKYNFVHVPVNFQTVLVWVMPW